MDREKVIRAIDICLGHGKCNDCGYHSGANYSDQNCRGRMLQDVLILLKEQEAVVRCKDCKHGDPFNGGEIYCEKDIGTIETSVHKPDWFCADGERR